MDLSILEGGDPAGYKAEEKIKELKKRAAEPFAFRGKRPKNPGNAFVPEVSQRTSYRRTKQRDLDKMNFESKQRRIKEATKVYEGQRQALKETMANKTAKRREKRMKKEAAKKNQLSHTHSNTKQPSHETELEEH